MSDQPAARSYVPKRCDACRVTGLAMPPMERGAKPKTPPPGRSPAQIKTMIAKRSPRS